MDIDQALWTEKDGWTPHNPGTRLSNADLVLLFGSNRIMEQADLFGSISAAFPTAAITGCSTAGEILDTSVHDDTLTCTAVSFAKTQCRQAVINIEHPEDSFTQGAALAEELSAHRNLCHVLLFSDGLGVNGTELINGLRSMLPPEVNVTGGLAADDERFETTHVVANGIPAQNKISAIGLYSKDLSVGFGSFGGWDPFGPERLITRAQGNNLYELDGLSALELYKKYLGEHAKQLPASALLFPLAIRTADEKETRVRTILSIREKENCMVFAGDIPEGHYARFMKCNMDRLIDGATTAAEKTIHSVRSSRNELALLVSCVGRRMVLRQRVEEEIESVREVLGPQTAITGFYSYGEISPMEQAAKSELLNQTMTITTFSELRDE